MNKSQSYAPLIYKKLMLYQPSDKELEIYTYISNNKKLITKFTKKEWGTWNIDGWFLSKDWSIPVEDKSLIAGGGSDWEYAFRVARGTNVPYVFSGGNHGREKLKSLKIVENLQETSEIRVDIGEVISVDSLSIMENTLLTFDDAFKNKYADVERVYTIYSSKLKLQTKFKFTSDVYMGTSYVCMFPTSKKRGRYIKFLESGNEYKTPKTGETLTTNEFDNYIGKEKTLAVKIYGESDFPYSFKVSIQNESMVEYFKNKYKVFYWDANEMGNKLYFSRYNNEDYKLIKAGTQWVHEQEWEIVKN